MNQYISHVRFLKAPTCPLSCFPWETLVYPTPHQRSTPTSLAAVFPPVFPLLPLVAIRQTGSKGRSPQLSGHPGASLLPHHIIQNPQVFVTGFNHCSSNKNSPPTECGIQQVPNRQHRLPGKRHIPTQNISIPVPVDTQKTKRGGTFTGRKPCNTREYAAKTFKSNKYCNTVFTYRSY